MQQMGLNYSALEATNGELAIVLHQAASDGNELLASLKQIALINYF
jgi:hypothetical protein